jgi:hypothetical protein
LKLGAPIVDRRQGGQDRHLSSRFGMAVPADCVRRLFTDRWSADEEVESTDRPPEPTPKGAVDITLEN